MSTVKHESLADIVQRATDSRLRLFTGVVNLEIVLKDDKERTKRMERILVNLREMFRFDDEDKWENTIKAIDEALK